MTNDVTSNIKRVIKKPDIIKSSKLRSDLWDEYISCIDNEHSNKSDEMAFSMFITLLSHFYEAVDELDKNGLFYDSTDQFGKLLLKSNPAHKTMADTNRMLVAYYQRFGITEWDRKANEKRFRNDKDDGDDLGSGEDYSDFLA